MAATAVTQLQGFAQSGLDIDTRAGRQHFTVYLAVTPAQQERGLMFVRQLPAREGMLFMQPGSRRMWMWMKNTLLPLDMLFIDASGRVACVRARTVPQSEELIGCEAPVSAVLELGGGVAERFGIGVGDRVLLPEFSR